MRRVSPKKSKKTRKINFKKIMLLIFLVILVCLMIHPIQLIKSNLFKPMSVAVGANNTRPSRYSQSEVSKNTYIDAAGKEYRIEFKQNLSKEVLLSYEQIVSHKAEVVQAGNNAASEERKDLYIAEMKSIPNLNYESRYRKQYEWKEEVTSDIYDIARNDSTITKTESGTLAELWGVLKLGRYLEVRNQERILENNQSLFNVGQIYANTKTLALYKRSAKILTVGNGLTAGEAYIMASNRNQSTSLDTDKNQQALWMINDEVADVEEIPTIYKGINPEAAIVGSNVGAEATALKGHTKSIEEFKSKNKVDGQGTEIYDNMLDIFDKEKKTNYYESGMAGLVAYDETAKEYVVGPFSIDYVRTVYVPIKGGQNENQNREGTIIFNSIIDAEVYGLGADGKELKLDDWEFVYTDVEYDLKAGKATRIAETNAIKNQDTSPNIYPYPNENFYIKFKNPNVQAITKLEFKTSSLNAEAEVYLYEGQYYNVSWKGAAANGKSFLQMTPSWTEIKNKNIRGTAAADLYQVKSARIIIEEKNIRLSLGKYHEKYNDYCIPITMELAGNVWYDGTEVEAVKTNKVFGVRDKNEKGEYVENGVENVYVHLYEDGTNRKIASTVTDRNGDYIFKYVKVGPKYYIEFEYDGMKYKATTYLNGDTTNEDYKDSSKFLNYLDYSHAKEFDQDRIDYNNKYTEIKNSGSRTSGQAISNNESKTNISYTTQSFTENYIGGTADIDRYNLSTTTKTAQLVYPLQNSYVITNKDISFVDQNQKYLIDLGIENIFVLGRVNLATTENYIVKSKHGEKNKDIKEEENFITEDTVNYTMIDTYLHHINLGLIERAPIDFAIKSDIVQTMYTFNDDPVERNILDFGNRSFDVSSFDIASRANTADTKHYAENYSYEVGYHDYIHRYDFFNNTNSIENDQAQLYVQYKMTILNHSEITAGNVTELVNYYEDDLYYPVDSNETWRYYDKNINYVEEWEKNGKKGYGNIVIPDVTDLTSWFVKKSTTGVESELKPVAWNSNSKFGRENNKNISNTGLRAMYTSSIQDVLLAPGESIDIYIVYKVEVTENTAIKNGYGKYISNDNAGDGKRNIIEINAYKAKNIDSHLTEYGGRVDKDSAPGNIEIDNYITYEDDTDAAPFFKALVNLDNPAVRGNSIVGYVWDDEVTELSYDNNQKVGNGKIDRDPVTNKVKENYINNVMVELIRLEFNQATGEYEEVEFTEKYKNAYPEKYTAIYPYTNEALSGENPNSIVSWTGPNHNNGNVVRILSDGEYRFDNLVSGGKYKVRFTYGTEKELTAEIANLSSIQRNKNIYAGHDYKSITTNGRMDIRSVPDSTDVVFVVDTYEIVQKTANGEAVPIINVLKEINSTLRRETMDENNQSNVNIAARISYGTDNYRVCDNFDQMTQGSVGDTPFSAREAIFNAGEILVNSDAENKIMIIYNDGNDSKLEDVKVQIANCINRGITVIGIGKGSGSLGVYKTENNGKTVSIYTLSNDKTNNLYVQENVIEQVFKQIIDNYYLSNTEFSHSEDYLQNTTYYTLEGNPRNVTGRLEVMKYSQEMTPFIADTLNLNYIKNLNLDLNINSELSKAIRTLANSTQMTADSYVVSFSGSEQEQVTLNLALQEIPERKIEVTNQVDNIVVKLASGRKLIDWSPQANVVKNVQVIPDELFSIYMDEEIMQGATIDVTYKIAISNIGDVDTLYSYVEHASREEKINWYNTLTGEKIPLNTREIDIDAILLETESIKISKLYSYYDNLIFRAEDNNKWEIVNGSVVNGENTAVLNRGNIRNERTVWSEVKAEGLSVLKKNEDRIQKYFVVETTSLKDIELYPKDSTEVFEDRNSLNNSKRVSSICTYLRLSKTLSPEDINAKDALNYRNYVEIIETVSNTGRRDYNAAEGNFTGDATNGEEQMVSERDIDNAERIIILPPFGDKKLMIGIIIAVLAILGIGIIFIKKKVL